MIVWLLGAALAGEARVLTLDGGLVVSGEVLETLAGGFRVRVAQGTVYVPFDRLVDLRDGAADVPPWTVLVLGPGDLAGPVAAALGLRPGVLAGLPGGAGQLAQGDVAACVGDLGCVAALAPDRFVVSVEPSEEGVWLRSRVPFAAGALQVPLAPHDPDAAWDALTAALGIELDALPDAWSTRWSALDAALIPHTRRVLEPPAPPAPRRAGGDLALVFAPFPGLSNLKRGDYAGFGGALATTAGATTGWVFASGAVSTRRGEHIAVGLLGAYGTSVLSSALFATTRAKAVAGVLPQDGGATLVVMGALR